MKRAKNGGKKGEKDRHIKFNVLLYTVKLPNLEHWTNIGTHQKLHKIDSYPTVLNFSM